MLKKIIIKPALFACMVSACGYFANAQSFNYSTSTQWLETPKVHEVSKEFAAASAVGILDDRNIEYKLEAKELQQYATYHRIIKINDDKGIEMYNKIYVPVPAGALLSNLKARTILANGKVISLPAAKIKEIEEEGRTYKLFAMEGVEKGSEVEYTYSVKNNLSFFGTEVYQGTSIPHQRISFSLTVPQYLKFDAKGFNGFKISADSVIGDNRIIVGYDENLGEIDDEKYAVREPYLKRVEYKLSYNLSVNKDVRLYTWKDFAKKAYSIYTTLTPKEEKPLASFLSKIDLSTATSEEAKILAIEDYIKSSINIDKKLVGENGSLVDKIISNKAANNQGVIKLFSALFEKTGIDYQIVFLGPRNEFAIDEELEDWNQVEQIVFYFPQSSKYLSPVSVDLRYPYIPAYWAGTKGLFLKGTSIGSFKTAIGSFKEIAMEPFEKHAHNMEVTAKFNATLDTLLITSKQIAKGYGAISYLPVYAFLPKDKQEEANLEIVKSVAAGTDIKNIKVENTSFTGLTYNKPYTISADIKSTDLIEHAGNKVLLKIGEIIGPQEQMYQEKPRRLPIEMPYPHVLERKIALQIPEGYKVKNLKDLNLSMEYKEGDELTMGFVSTYQQVGNTVNISVLEWYKRYSYPLSRFEDFKKIINASADFNKIVLVLEKI